MGFCATPSTSIKSGKNEDPFLYLKFVPYIVRASRVSFGAYLLPPPSLTDNPPRPRPRPFSSFFKADPS